jgi:pilus assembly protein CpaF
MSMNVPIFVQREQDGVVLGDLGSIDFEAPFEFMLGRNPTCELHLDANDVSRRHARVCLGPDGYLIEDLSNNGTLTCTGGILRRQHGQFAYGTHFTVGPFRVTVGRPGQTDAPPAPRGDVGRCAAARDARSSRPFPIAEDATPPRGTPIPQKLDGAKTQVFTQSPVNGPDLQATGPNHIHRSATPAPAIHPPPAAAAMPFVPPAGFLVVPQQKVQANVAMTPQEVARQRAMEMKHSEELINLRRKVHGELLKNLDFAKIDTTKQDPGLRPRVLTALKRIVVAQNAPILEQLDKDTFIGELLDEALGLGPLEPILADASVTEVMVVDPATIYVERGGKLELTTTRFTDEERVRAVIERIVTPLGRRIDESQPLVDARLADGSRVNAIIRPLALRGSCITIRRFPKRRLTMEDFYKLGSITPRMAKFLERAVVAKKNILISGGTGSGKTTLLNVLSSAIPAEERIVTIEDAAELQLHQPHVVSLETKHANMEGRGAFTIRDLVKNSLRMRPDRIVVGECRGGEALDMLQAMNTGHDGSLTTIHANSPVEALARLETLVLMAGVDLPSQAIREQISRSIHVIVQQTRFTDGTRKITHISEIAELDPTGRFEVREIFEFEQNAVSPEGYVLGDFEATGYLPSFLDEVLARGLVKPGEPFL